MGAVQSSAPHSTGGFHCNDLYDVMCYNDGGPRANPFVECGAEEKYDCRGDDYFDTRTSSTEYLANHWISARAKTTSWLSDDGSRLAR